MSFGKISFDPVDYLIGADMGDIPSRKIQIHQPFDNSTDIGGGFFNIVADRAGRLIKKNGFGILRTVHIGLVVIFYSSANFLNCQTLNS